MQAAEYRDALRRVLESMTAVAAARLATLAEAATARTEGVTITVFVEQDAEGPFAVWLNYEGPDSFTLNQRFGHERELFGVTWTEDGWEPDVPPRPRGWSHADLEEAVLDTVAEWIAPMIPTTDVDLHWEVVTPDGALDPRPVGPQP